MGGKIALTFQGRVSKEVRREIESFCARLPAVTEIRHKLPVFVVNAQGICLPGGKPAFGIFRIGTLTGPTIWIAGQPPAINAEGDALPLRCFLEIVVETLAHEIAHYEQFRDGKTVQERGVNVRMRNIVSKVQNNPPGPKE